MNEKQHSVTPPSSMNIFINCPAALKLSEGFEDKSGPAAEEGTEAHALCEFLIRSELGEEVEDPIPSMNYYTPEMMDHAECYKNFVLDKLREAKREDPEVLMAIEERVDFSKWTDTESFGTADCIIVTDTTIRIIDFKYGFVEVDAKNNAQMLCYALGALEKYGFFYSHIEHIEMTIYQPRKFNESTWMISKDELLEWGENVLHPAIEEALSGKANAHAGDHCRYCRARFRCEERASYNLALEEKMETPVALLSDEDIEDVLNRADAIRQWVSDIEEYALNLAISGKNWKGFELGTTTTKRRYSDEFEVARVVRNAGFDPYETKVMPISAMTKMLGKKRFEDIVGPYVMKPEGKPKLVKRKEN